MVHLSKKNEQGVGGAICFGKLGNYRYSQFRDKFNKYIFDWTEGVIFAPYIWEKKAGVKHFKQKLGNAWPSLG